MFNIFVKEIGKYFYQRHSIYYPTYPNYRPIYSTNVSNAFFFFIHGIHIKD